MDYLFPTFRLFADPIDAGSFEQSDAPCDICQLSRGWKYALSTFGENDEGATLCPWCIAEGKAQASGYFFNCADIFPVLSSTPKLSVTDYAEVEGMTPGFTTWQDHGWQICCDRACQYLGEASAEDLQGRWIGAVDSILSMNAGWTDAENTALIRSIKKGGNPCAYVFKCVVCTKLHAHWDDL